MLKEGTHMLTLPFIFTSGGIERGVMQGSEEMTVMIPIQSLSITRQYLTTIGCLSSKKKIISSAGCGSIN